MKVGRIIYIVDVASMKLLYLLNNKKWVLRMVFYF